MPIIYRAGLSNYEISYAESVLNTTFPADYRAFLSERNGFYIDSPDYSEIKLTSIEDGLICFDRLFGIREQEQSNDLVAFNTEFISELNFMRNPLAIGEDGGGNPFVINPAGVFYWDRTHLHQVKQFGENDIRERDGCGNLFYLSSSFGDFYNIVMDSLGEKPEFVLA